MLAFYDDYGRGMDGMQLPYTASCFRAAVIDQQPRGGAAEDTAEDTAPGAAEERDSDAATPAEETEVSDGTDTDMLLIDFR